ncbi:MAG: ABC transporter permease subunit [Bdellovibrionaceae bacterium]|nr:ABC transporter permease subunit [Pseudobdellovibrionaceae bacterium]
MFKYILKRLLMMIPTFIGITLVSFFIINAAPGGPVEQRLKEIRFGNTSSGGEASATSTSNSNYGVSDEVIAALKKQYGFDKPVHIRYFIWLKNILTLDFGESFSYEEPVIDVIISKLPVSVQFGVISLILTYLISIPLGIRMAVKEGTAFDFAASGSLFVLYSIPSVMLGILLLIFFAGGSFLDWFPLGGLYSDQYYNLSFWGKVQDRIHHFILPLICYMIGGFTVLSLLMKNSLLGELKKDYVRTARAKGLDERKVIYKHALRNALIPVVTGIGGFIGVFFAGSLIIEQIFNLDGIGLLGFKSTLDRDYNVIMALLFITSCVTLVGRLISDIIYVIVDPRMNFK